MSSSYLVDDNNEMVIIDGIIQIVKSSEEVAQRVQQYLQSYQEDFFLNRLHGIPYFQEIYTKPMDLSATESLLQAEIIALDGVEEITYFETNYNRENRRLTIGLRLIASDGSEQEVSI